MKKKTKRVMTITVAWWRRWYQLKSNNRTNNSDWKKKRIAQKVYSCAKFGAQPKPCELFDLFTVLPMFCIFCFSITCATDNNLWIQLSSVTDTYVYDGLYIVYIHTYIRTYAHIWSILIVSMHFTWTMHHYTVNN